MIPDLIKLSGAPWKVLPEGIHQATLAEIEADYTFNVRRRELFSGLKSALSALAHAKVRYVYLDGSFLSDKPIPGDYDACWNVRGVDVQLLDPVFLEFANGRSSQKNKYLGEFFFEHAAATPNGQIFLDFFQIEKTTGEKKGIILIDLTAESFGLPLVYKKASK